MKFLLSLCLVASLSSAFAQTGVEGKVLAENEAIPYVNIALYVASDTSLVKAGYSDVDGRFKLLAPAGGAYFVEFTQVGMTTVNKPMQLAEGVVLDLGNVELSSSTIGLDVAEVTALRPMIEVKPDKIQFNVDGTTNAIGSNGLELMRKAPGIVIDNNNSIILQGKTGVQILINGKRTPMSGDDLTNYLQSLQASDIDNIEIINNPGVQFDAEGNAGVINIILKRQKGLGTNGNISLGYSIGERARYDGSVGLNHRGKRFNVFGNYSHFNGINKNFNHFYREQFGRSFDQFNDNLSDSQNHGLRFGADWFLNDKHTLGILVNGNLNNFVRNDFSNTPIVVLATNELESRLIANTVNNGTSQNYTANLNYIFRASDSLKVSFDLDYGTFNNLSDVDQPNRYFSDEGENLLFENIYEQETEADISLASAKTDFTLLGLGGTLSFGAKGAQVITNNRFDFFNVINDVAEIDTNRTNTFRYEEQVLAGYLNYERKLNDKWGVNAGARLEYTDAFGELTSLNGQTGEGLDTNYVNLFPSVGFSYAPNQKHSFSLGYGKRIERPNYQSLNPFESQIDELSFEKGNPFLRPQFTHNISLSHTYQYRFTTSLTYSRVLDGFARWTDTRGDNATFITPLNLATQDIVSLNFSAPLTITKKWSAFANLGANYNHNQSDFSEFAVEGEEGVGRVVDISVFTANVYMQHSYQLTDTWKIELSGLYSSPGLWQGIFKTRRYWFVDLGVQKQLWDGKANLRLALDDVFFSRQWAGSMNYGNLNLLADGGSDSRRFKVNFTYKFGDAAVKKTRRRNTGIESESKRAAGN